MKQSDNIALTPSQKHIERIIEYREETSQPFTQVEAADMLRALNNITNNLRQSLHYHGGAYEKHLVNCNFLLIEEIGLGVE